MRRNLNGNKIIGTWDMYLLNSDITSIMKQEEQHVNKPILFYFWIVNVKIKTKEII
jgi:hypothetical protein